MVFFTDNTLAETLVIVGCILILSFLLTECFEWTRFFSYTDILFQYCYETHNGPHTWRTKFPQSRGSHQSPINITSNYAIVLPIETKSSIQFSSEYFTLPKYMVLTNDSHGVVLYACWNQGASPTISGGPLSDKYQFINARFKWGPNKDEGSEHTINNVRFGMEIQAVHVKPNYRNSNISVAAGENAVVIISYLFQVTPNENPYLEPIISCLSSIQCPLEQAQIEPIPLSWLIPPFTSKYYSYSGSISYPPCTEGVTWIVQSEPLSISAEQLNQFRGLLNLDGYMNSNTRPVQEVNSREIYFYD